MKLSIRLQNHGCRNHPLWWIVVAPNRKNIKGRFTEHVGYWHIRMTHDVKRGAIMNLARVKHWIKNGAVPTSKVQRLLYEYGVMPKPWYYVKSEQELQKLKPNEQQLDDKKKRKIQAKQQKKIRQQQGYLSVFQQYNLSRRPLPFKRNWQRLYITVNETVIQQQRENDMLRNIMLQTEYKKYQLMRKLSGNLDTQGENLDELQKKLKVLQEDLAYLEKNTINLHPVKKAMIMQKINELVPKIYELREKQDREIENQTEMTIQQIVSKRRALHQVMVKRITSITKQIQTYYKMLQPLTRESYLQYLVNKIGMNYNEALKQVDTDFAEYEEEGIAPTKGELYKHYNFNRNDVDQEDEQVLNPDFVNSVFNQYGVQPEQAAVQGEEGEQVEVDAQQSPQQPAQQSQATSDQPIQGSIQQDHLHRQPTDQLSPQQIALLMQQQASAQPQPARFNHLDQQDWDPSIYNLMDAQSVAKLVKDNRLILPTSNHVNPFPDLKSYVPEEYYEIPDRHADFLKSVPAYYPEDELMRYREKMRTKKQVIKEQVKEWRKQMDV